MGIRTIIAFILILTSSGLLRAQDVEPVDSSEVQERSSIRAEHACVMLASGPEEWFVGVQVGTRFWRIGDAIGVGLYLGWRSISYGDLHLGMTMPSGPIRARISVGPSFREREQNLHDPRFTPSFFWRAETSLLWYPPVFSNIIGVGLTGAVMTDTPYKGDLALRGWVGVVAGYQR